MILLMCSSQLQLLVNVKPKCLCDEASVIGFLFIYRGGCRGVLRFNDKIWEIFLAALKSTSHCAAHVSIQFSRNLKWWLQCSDFQLLYKGLYRLRTV